MRVFLTGGTGYIGSAVLEAFVRGGHHVDALVRNSEKAAMVQAHGGHPVLGDLAKPASFSDAVAVADVVVHTAIDYSPRGPKLDASFVDAALMPGDTRRAFLYTSGIWALGPGTEPMDETAPAQPAEISAWRLPHEQRVLDANSYTVRTAVIRPGIVYGGWRGIVGDLLKSAANGLIRVVGSGDNHWPLIYDRDLGDLYVRIATNPEASGLFHANDEGDETVNEIVAALSDQAPIKPSLRHVPLKEAHLKMGPLADALALDQIVRSPRAKALGWHPTLHSVSGNVARLFEEFRRGREAA